MCTYSTKGVKAKGEQNHLEKCNAANCSKFSSSDGMYNQTLLLFFFILFTTFVQSSFKCICMRWRGALCVCFGVGLTAHLLLYSSFVCKKTLFRMQCLKTGANNLIFQSLCLYLPNFLFSRSLSFLFVLSIFLSLCLTLSISVSLYICLDFLSCSLCPTLYLGKRF